MAFEIVDFMLLLLLTVGGIIWLLWFGLTKKKFEIGKLISNLLLFAVLFGILLLGFKEAKFLWDQSNSQEKESKLNAKYLEYGIGFDLITGVLGTLLFAMIGIGTFEALKARSEERSREEKLNNSAKCVERLSYSRLYGESYEISKNLFEDIFKEFKQDKQLDLSDPICTAYLSNLGVYGQCRLETGGIDQELKNLIEVEKIYEELVQTLYQSTIWPRISSEGWEERTRVFASKFILGKKNDEKYTVHTFLWHARFLNCWADVLIRLSRYVERKRYLAQAETVIGWACVGVFELADEEDGNGEVHNCLEFILERIRYHRLRGDLFHEQNHIANHRNLSSYKNGLPNEKGLEEIEHEYRQALRWVSSLAPFATGWGSKGDVLPVWLDYRPNISLSACPPLPYNWEKNSDDSSAAHPVESLERILCKRVRSAIKKGAPSHYLWSDIDRCKCKTGSIREALDRIEESDIKPKDAQPSVDEFLDELLTEIVKVYLRVAQNSIRYIAEANERSDFLPGNEYEESDRLINRVLGRARSLVDFELSWKHNVLFYNVLGVYLLEKGRYEERRENRKQAEELYKTSSRVHEMTRLHLIDCSDEGIEIAEGAETSAESEWYNNVDSLIYLRNLIDLGRTRQHLYRLQYTKPYEDQIILGPEERRKKFQAAQRILLQALKLTTKTKNFICRAEAHLALADLYAVDEDYWGSAIIAYRCCIETFTRDEYTAYHDKVCSKLADFYVVHHTKFDKIQKAVFIKSFNLCADFDNQDTCEHYRLKGDLRQHIGELFKHAPNECPEITCGRCKPHYWSDC